MVEAKNSTDIDIAVYVALSEEFATVSKVLGKGFQPDKLRDLAITCLRGAIRTHLDKPVRILVVPAGKMGNTRSANVMSAILTRFAPKNVVVIGIAGSLVHELQPGDVLIPDQVNEYLANAATVGKESWTFETSGNEFSTDPRLLNTCQFSWATRQKEYSTWRSQARSRFRRLINEKALKSLRAAGLELRAQSELFVGDDRKIASGPAVGKGTAFVNWLKEKVDRKAVAIEMESAGVYDAAIIRTPAPKAMAIRGISDFADERKKVLETVVKGGFRVLAAANATAYFKHAVHAGLFDEHPVLSSGNQSSAPIESRVRSVFVIGGVTDETKHPAHELPRLQIACLELGRSLATAGVKMIVCSPFPDSADYYSVSAYAHSGAGGVIEFHSPRHSDVDEKHKELLDILGDSAPKIVRFGHPGPELGPDIEENREAWRQAWLLSQLEAVERAEMVVAIGGRASRAANTLLHLAERQHIPILPFTFLSGAAQRAFARQDWTTIHPAIDPKVLAREDGVKEVIALANQLLTDVTLLDNRPVQHLQTLFVSRAHQDSSLSDLLCNYLQTAGFEVLTGDGAAGPSQLVPTSIEQAILKAGIFIVLWSARYALSPWCYDELMFALALKKKGHVAIWLFDLDGSAIVPTEARKLKKLRVRTPSELVAATKELLVKAGHRT